MAVIYNCEATTLQKVLHGHADDGEGREAETAKKANIKRSGVKINKKFKGAMSSSSFSIEPPHEIFTKLPIFDV